MKRMPSIGFTVFKEKILSGEKRQTIRKVRKRIYKKGDTLFLYWHLRQKDCELLRIARCTLAIKAQYRDIIKDNKVAKADGFRDAWELKVWFDKVHKPKMEDKFWIIRW